MFCILFFLINEIHQCLALIIIVVNNHILRTFWWCVIRLSCHNEDQWLKVCWFTLIHNHDFVILVNSIVNGLYLRFQLQFQFRKSFIWMSSILWFSIINFQVPGWIKKARYFFHNYHNMIQSFESMDYFFPYGSYFFFLFTMFFSNN